MTRLVHLAPESAAKRIRRNGIAPTRARHPMHGYDRFVWAFPRLQSYAVSHQWLRELKRNGARTLVAVDIAMADDQPVLVGHFGSEPQLATASRAAGLVRAAPDPRGYEILVPRRIEAREIVRIRNLTQGIGWRYFPDAKAADRRPCDCPVCVPSGEIKGQRYRSRIPALQARWDTRRTASSSNVSDE